jgi:integrase
MQLRQFEKRENSKAVWLTDREVDELLETTDDELHRFALSLMARAGLRVGEVHKVQLDDLVKTEHGHIVRVWQGKGDKYREAPIPAEIYWIGRSIAEGQQIIRHTKRTLQDWVTNAADQMFRETEEVGWSYVSAHDLRRSWATLLIQSEVEPLLVMEWGGWSDYEVFRDHYMSIHDPDFQADERQKVPWL